MGNKHAKHNASIQRHSINELRGSQLQSSVLMDEVTSQANSRKSTNLCANFERNVLTKANVKNFSTRQLNKMIESKEATGVDELVSDKLLESEVHGSKYTRVEEHEEAVLAGINSYRQEHGRGEIKAGDKFERELTEICALSLQRGAFNSHVYKKRRACFKEVAICSENSLFLQQVDNTWESPVIFSSAVLSKWTYVSSTDMNLRMESANACSIRIMTDGTSYCVFLLMYREQG